MVIASEWAGSVFRLMMESDRRLDILPHDLVIEKDGVRVVIDPKTLLYLQGTVLDFTDGLNGKGFTFQNPNAKTTCGCGSSFSA